MREATSGYRISLMKKIIAITAACLLLVGCSLFQEHVLQGKYTASSRASWPYAWEFFGDGVKTYDRYGDVLQEGIFEQTSESKFTVWWSGSGKEEYSIRWMAGWKESFYCGTDVYTLV